MMIYNPETKGLMVVYTTTKPQYNTNNDQQQNAVLQHVPDLPASQYNNMSSAVQNSQSNFIAYALPDIQANKFAHFNNRFCAGLGITQIVIGVLAIVMNIVIYGDRQYKLDYYISHGLWGGTFFIITGSLGTAAGLLNNSCLIISFMVMSIFAVSLLVPAVMAISAIGLFFNLLNFEEPYDSYDLGIAMESCIFILCVLELLIGIMSATVCCQAVCCCKPAGIVTNNPQQQGNVQATQANRYAHFYNRFSVGLGITQIVIGVLAIAMNIVLYVDRYHTYYYFFSHGVLGGICFIITGSLGTAAGLVKTRGLIVCFMVLSIITVFIPALNMLIISAIDLDIVVRNKDIYNYYEYYYNYYDGNRIGIAMESVILTLSVLELVIGILSAAVCCHAVCCARPSAAQSTTYSSNLVYPQYLQQPVSSPEYMVIDGRAGRCYSKPTSPHV